MKKQFDFIGNLKIYLIISSAIMLIGILFNIIFGTALALTFKGGTLLRYTYTGNVDIAKIQPVVREVLGEWTAVSLDVYNDTPVITVSLADSVTLDQQKALLDKLTSTFPDYKIDTADTSTRGPTVGRMFFIKCLIAIAISSLFLLIYVGFRFRKIGGLSAGAMGLLALLHDVLVVYFVFVIFRIELDDNFVAVVLTILGFSLNDTIVIFDRIRENRRKMEKNTPIEDIVNTSINQSLTRSLNTSICTFLAIATVAVVASILHIDSIIRFAVPMAFGIISGCYSSVCLSGPLWVKWLRFKEKRAAKAPKTAKAR